LFNLEDLKWEIPVVRPPAARCRHVMRNVALFARSTSSSLILGNQAHQSEQMAIKSGSRSTGAGENRMHSVVNLWMNKASFESNCS
jgi:hypothetical protein